MTRISILINLKIAMADDFRSGTRSAAAGGTTTIISFACQHRGESLRKVVHEYHKKANGKGVIDYAFHLIISDTNRQVMGQELPAMIEDGYTSFKIYDLSRIKTKLTPVS